MLCGRAGWSNDTYRRLGNDHYGGLFRCREVIHALQAGRAVDCLVELGRKKASENNVCVWSYAEVQGQEKNIRSHRIHWNDIFCTLLEQVDNLKVQVRRNSAVFLCTALTSPPHFLSSLEAPTTAKWGYWKNACCFSWSCSESMTDSEEQSL